MIMAVIFGAALLLGIGYWYVQKPSHDKQWILVQAKLPQVAITPEQFTLTNIRDFRYAAAGAIASERYVNTSYRFDQLQRIWYGISHFGPQGFAHVFLSFEFADQQFLVLSIEARLEQNEKYSPWLGLVRRYEKIFLFGTEADVIGLRSHSRGERVLLYPLLLEREVMDELLKNYLHEAEQLATKPQFYNTLLGNCMTGLLRASRHFSTWDFISNADIILPGRSDQLAHKLGLLGTDTTLADLRQRAEINSILSDPSAEKFSQQIRAQWAQAMP